MNILKNKYLATICLLAMVLFTACDEDETLEPFMVNFNSGELNISSQNSEVEAVITFSRPATVRGEISLVLTPGTLEYGETKDFYTSVAPVDNTISLPFVAGDQNVSLTVYAGEADALQEDEMLAIKLVENMESVFTPGSTQELQVMFSGNFVAQSGSLEMSAGGEAFDQRAYVDLSKATSNSVAVDNFDLGFQSGDGFYVTLNASTGIMARPLDKTSLTDVVAADTINFKYEMTIPPPNFDASIGSVAWIDAPDGDLSNTAFGEISATDSENKVFIIKRERGNWKKVRVLRSPDGYTLRYADIAALDFTSLVIPKNSDLERATVDLEQGIVEAEPKNANWDLLYGTYTKQLSFGPGSFIPYQFKDYIIINRGDISTAVVMTADVSYDSFTLDNTSSLEFEEDINAIGARWRSGGGPTSDPALFDDRFYIIKDGDENIYKLRFTSLLSDSDERGKPSFIYELLN